MGPAGRHQDQFTAAQLMAFAGDDDFDFAFDHLHQRIERCGVLAQALAGIEREEGHIARRFPHQFAADHGAVLVIGKFTDGHRPAVGETAPGGGVLGCFYTALHGEKVAVLTRTGFDRSQILDVFSATGIGRKFDRRQGRPGDFPAD